MPLEVIDETQQFRALDSLREKLERYLKKKKIKQIVTLILLTDEKIRELNNKDRGINKATDVLSYPMHEPDDVGMPLVEQLGDVFISVDTAKRQAKAKNHSLENEILILAAHGITHLRGYDHDSEKNWQIFKDEQEKVLELKDAKV